MRFGKSPTNYQQVNVSGNSEQSLDYSEIVSGLFRPDRMDKMCRLKENVRQTFGQRRNQKNCQKRLNPFQAYSRGANIYTYSSFKNFYKGVGGGGVLAGTCVLSLSLFFLCGRVLLIDFHYLSLFCHALYCHSLFLFFFLTTSISHLYIGLSKRNGVTFLTYYFPIISRTL